jgi:serine phosphatase RsbU (regulator of sigma subunit)
LILFGLYRWRTAALRARQKQLELTVEERTQELKHEKEIVEEKHKEITDSINYAERIQRSFLASREMLDENLNLGVTSSVRPLADVPRSDPGYFVFFQPKDVVSGDFYWASILKNGNFAFCCADSTGHGVPGAIMSIANIACLKEAVTKGYQKPDEILNETRKLVIEYLKNDGSTEGGKDGMDCSLLVLSQDKTQLTFASANNPVFIVTTKNGVAELVEAKPDKMPVGKHDKDQEPFTLQTAQLQQGDVIYTLTDGFPDQFGGEKGKKYMIKNLKELFLSISHLPMIEQHDKLLEEFTNWKGENEQVDDVCIVGVRV